MIKSEQAVYVATAVSSSMLGGLALNGTAKHIFAREALNLDLSTNYGYEMHTSIQDVIDQGLVITSMAAVITLISLFKLAQK